MVDEAFAQTLCGEGTKSVTKDGVLTCVLDGSQPKPTGSFSGISPNLDFSSPDAIQNSLQETLLPNLINMDKLGNVAEASPIVYDILIYLTSLAGIIPLFAGGLVGIAFLIRKMKKDKMQNKAESGVLQYLCMKCDVEMKEADYLEYGGLCVKHRTKKKFKLHMPKMTMPKINLNLKKKSKDPDLDVINEEMKKRGIDNKEDYDKMMSEVHPDNQKQPESYEEYLQQEMESMERDLDVITDPEEATEVMEEIDDMRKEKDELEEQKFNSPEEALIDSLDPVRTELKDPEDMSVEELEAQIKEKGHTVEVSDGQLDIKQNPDVTVETKPELESLKEVVETNANKMEDEFTEAIGIDDDFEPSDDEIKEAQGKFEKELETNAEPVEQEPPNEEDILEVQRLMGEGMSQEDAIQQVISTKVVEEPKQEKQIIDFVQKDGEKTIEEQHEAQDIDEMSDERDIFQLDVPKKKQSPLQKKLSSTVIGKKLFKNTDLKQKEKERNKETRQVLTDLGEQRMLEYASKIDDKLQKWAEDQLHHTYEPSHKTSGEKNLSPAEIEQELKKLALFASMCEMMADKKTSKKRYWKRTNKYVKAT